jgi:DNA polymerase
LNPPDTVIAQPNLNTMQFSALQLAWMQELGIDKPWIPGAATPKVIPSAAAVATSPLPDAGANTRAPQSAAQASDAGTFVQAGMLARGQVAAATMPPGVMQRSATGSSSSTQKSTDTPNEPLLDTVAAAAQATTLASLAATIAQCNACGLCKEREQVVVGQGVMQPAIMVIGEGPGDQEDRQGLPFVGRSGMLLDNMLSSIGSSRTTDVYAANIVKCRPPGNRNPRPNEIASCRPFLMRQIELVRPFSILALGRFAAQTLLGGEAQLAEMREQPFAIEHAGLNIPVVVSYHPAYLLRRPSDKAAAWRDLQRARAISKGL